MRIFISSVRAGLELERDALPGLVKALGHEPVRFEDFTAQPVPSRQACIDGVESSDAYLLLLGPHYGHGFVETGQSATHDEWVTAQRLGLPRYVFRKIGLEFDPDQQQFERALGDYGSGRFYKTFTDATDLQSVVASVIRELESAPQPLEFEPLMTPANVQWIGDENEGRRFQSSQGPLLEVHIVPVGARSLSGRLLEQLEAGLPAQVRTAGLVSPAEALQAVHGVDQVELHVPDPAIRRGLNEIVSGSLAGIRVLKGGQIAITFRLPGDGMGSILDIHEVSARIAAALRLAGNIDLTAADHIAIGVGLTSQSLVAVGNASRGPRNQVSMSTSSGALHVNPDELVSRVALDRGADEVASLLARSLIRAFEHAPR